MREIYVSSSTIEGTGCYAARAFSAGETLGEYTGEIISEDEADLRWQNAERVWFFDREDGWFIDATRDDNPVKRINHSCEPNCETIVEDGRVFVVALRDIEPDEELTYDYNLEVDEADDDPYVCRCGSSNCRGTLRAP